MNGNKAVFDSNVIIYAANKVIELHKTTEKYNEVVISVVSYMETMGFDFVNFDDQNDVEELLKQFKIIHTNAEIAEKVIEFRKKKKIKLPDAIVAATAFVLGADLITANVKDFKGLDKGLKVITPFEKN